ncbi:MAG: LapA family protein [Rhodobacteraceae bacterium]|jgi:lipopolysaccharide assembly protein A|nr:LapA family protein [Paracoccaceae bacterium]
MIRALRLLMIAALGLMLLTVALANRAPVTVRLLPDDLAAVLGWPQGYVMPLFLPIFAGIIAGLLIGFVWEWWREGAHRTTASVKSREVARLERELAQMRDAKGEAQDDILTLLDGPKR